MAGRMVSLRMSIRGVDLIEPDDFFQVVVGSRVVPEEHQIGTMSHDLLYGQPVHSTQSEIRNGAMPEIVKTKVLNICLATKLTKSPVNEPRLPAVFFEDKGVTASGYCFQQ